MKKRTILGFICIISALIFMVHSFLEPKSQLLIKPSVMEQMDNLGYYMYRQLIPQLADESDFIFYIKNSKEELPVIANFLEYGKTNDSRVYKLESVGEYEKLLPKALILESQTGADEEQDLTRIYILSLTSSNLEQAQAKKNLKTYMFYAYAVGPETVNKKCRNWKRAFQLKNLEDLDCFAKKQSKSFQKEMRKSKESHFFGAVEQILPKKYIFYYTTREAWPVESL